MNLRATLTYTALASLAAVGACNGELVAIGGDRETKTCEGQACGSSCTLVGSSEAAFCNANSACVGAGQPLRCTTSSSSPECTTNVECVARFSGESAICSKSTQTCLKLKDESAGCHFVMGADPAENDDVVVLGAFLPLENVWAPLAQPIALAYRLAIEEINKSGGIQSGSKSRPLSILMCDATPSNVEKGVRHLTETIKVPSMLALFSSTDLIRFVRDYAVPSQTFVLNPQDTTETLKNTDVNGLVWSLLGTPNEVARTYRPLVSRMETYERARLGNVTRPLRVAIVTSQSPREVDMDSVVRDDAQGIVVNTLSAKANEASGHLLRVSIPSREANPKATYSSYIQQIVAHRPDMVVLLTATESDEIVPSIDAALLAAGGASALPLYALSIRNSVSSYVNSDTSEPSQDKRKRFVGVHYGGPEGEAYSLYLDRMTTATPPVSVESYMGMENFYDAVYWLAFSLAAAGPDAPVTGASFKTGARKLLSGPPINLGPVSEITTAWNTITNNPTGVTFMGTLGTPDIDPTTGAWRGIGNVFCYPTGPTAVTVKYNDLRYNPSTGQLQGEFSCFAGF